MAVSPQRFNGRLRVYGQSSAGDGQGGIARVNSWRPASSARWHSRAALLRFRAATAQAVT
jgi:hypothetical protein